jgi:hypothetical protein
MDFSSALAFGHGYSKTLPKRRFRRRMALRRPVPRARSRRCSPARSRPSRGSKRAAVGGENRLAVALHASRPSSVGGHIPADETMDKGGGLRGDGPRFACAVADFGGEGLRSERGHPRLSHPALDPGERGEGRLRRSEEKERLEDSRGGGHPGTFARPSRRSGKRGRPKGRWRRSPRRYKKRPGRT